MLTVCYPHYLIESVVELSPERLRALGVENLLLDVDCTLKRYGMQELEPEITAWLEKIKGEGFRICLLSNGMAPRIGRFAEKVGLPFVAEAWKPLPRGCFRAMKEFGFERDKTAIVGDQIFADVMAGRFAGIRTFLTTAIFPEEEPWYTRMKRPFEKVVMRFYNRKFPDGVWVDPKSRKKRGA